MEEHPGKVYLVGAGPGDPGLLTLRGRDLLEQADVVIYDALSSPALLSYASRAEHIYVGKKTDQHSLPQEDIGRVLVDYAERHKVVVRLKGGDPFVFGRGGEEALVLAAAGIDFEVVPGVTAGIAATAYAGIPVTHRGVAGSVTFITGHRAVGEDDLSVSLKSLGLEGTLVFYMGVKTLDTIVTELLDLGRTEDTPVAVIEWGTYARQRTVTGTLNDIVSTVVTVAISSPALVVVGETVRFREELSWFEQRPLFGLRVAVTHARQRGDVLASRLRDMGASVFSFPTLEFEVQAQELSALNFDAMDWLLLTSVNSVAMVFESLEQQGKDSRALAGIKICTVGKSTTDALRCRSIQPDATPDRMNSAAVVGALESLGPLDGARIVIPRSDIARSSLGVALRERGARVDEVVTYATQLPQDATAQGTALLEFDPELIVFTNSTAVRNFARVMGGADDAAQWNSQFASIGPVTTLAARETGITISIEPDQHDIPHLLEAICAWRNT